MWVRVDGGPWIKWNGWTATGAWLWDDVHDSDAGGVVMLDLEQGSHSIELTNREPGAQLDRLVITRDSSLVPTGLGAP